MPMKIIVFEQRIYQQKLKTWNNKKEGVTGISDLFKEQIPYVQKFNYREA